MSKTEVERNLKLHVPIMLTYVATCVYELTQNNLAKLVPKSKGTFYESRFRFLTYWNVVLQTIFFTICVLGDLIAKDNKDHVLRRIQNRIMVSLAYPLAMFVGVTFWSIYLIDRELILPKAMDAFFPVWLNHCMHTNIVIFMLLEFVTSSYKYAPRAMNVKILLAVMLTYLIWLFVIYSATGVWVYPILHVLPWPMKIVFFIGCLGLAMGLYFSGEKLNAIVRNRQEVVHASAAQTVVAAEPEEEVITEYEVHAAAKPVKEKKEKKKKRSM